MLHFLFGLGRVFPSEETDSCQGNTNLLECLQFECEKDQGGSNASLSRSVSLGIHSLIPRKGMSEVAGSPQGTVLYVCQ